MRMGRLLRGEGCGGAVWGVSADALLGSDFGSFVIVGAAAVFEGEAAVSSCRTIYLRFSSPWGVMTTWAKKSASVIEAALMLRGSLANLIPLISTLRQRMRLVASALSSMLKLVSLPSPLTATF